MDNGTRKQANLLFISTDEQRPDTLSCYGNDFVQAPHLNALAQRSFVFENAYCTQPVCTPSRASIQTGLWPHTHGCVVNNTPLPTATPTLAELVNDSYHCAYYGKWHLGDEIIAQRGFDEWVSIEDAAYSAYYTDPSYQEKRSDYHHFLVRQGFPPDSRAVDGAQYFSRNFAAALAEPYTKANFLGERASEFLRAQNGERPFLLSVNFLEPHMPFYGPLNNLHDPDDVPKNPAFARAPDAKATLRNQLIAARYAANGFGGMELRTADHFQRLLANYYGLVTQVDNAVGKILLALEEFGHADNTIIVFTSDHGDMMGDYALIAKCVMNEPSIRVPLIMHVPGREGRRIAGRFSHIDLVPTLLDLLEHPLPPHLQGRSRTAALLGGEELGDAVVEWNPPWQPVKTPPPGFTVEQTQQVTDQTWRTLVSLEGWKINVCADDQCEFFDLNNDPHELTNLWNDETYSSRRDELLSRLRTWQHANNDVAYLGV